MSSETQGGQSQSRIGQDTRQYGEHRRQRAEADAQRYRRALVREAIDAGNRALVRTDWYTLGCLCRDKLAPALDVTEWDLDDYHGPLAESSLAWDWEAISRFLESPRQYVLAVARHNQESMPEFVRKQRLRVNGSLPGDEVARRTIERAFKSLESVAAAQGHIPAETTQSSAVLGHELQVGLQWQSWDYETPDQVRVVNPDIHPPFTIAIGQPGNGKSTAVDTIVEDAISSGQKIIDLIDFDELENGFYDVPNQQDGLQSKRRKLGLPATFEGHDDYDAPDLAILHPMCRGFCDSKLPYDTEEGAFTARPFVVPVADLDHSIIKALMNLSQTREMYLDSALGQMADEDDWSLADLGRRVQTTSADQGTKDRIWEDLRKLQNLGIFGTREHPDAIEWDRIFRDTDTVTVFSCSLVRQRKHKLLVASYLLDAIYEARKPDTPGETGDDGAAVTDYERALVVAREMQDVAPSQRKLSGGSTVVNRLKQELVRLFQRLGEKRRHVNVGIAGDTQQWLQVNAGVRANVDRVLMFKLQPGASRSVFTTLTGDDQRQHAMTVKQFGRGTCAVIGPQWIDSGQPFVLPVDWAPPMCHHLDADDEDEPDGWDARVLYKDSEEFRPSPWSMDDDDAMAGAPEAYEDGEDPTEKTPDGFEAFLEECVHGADDDEIRVRKARLRDAYRGFAADHGLEDGSDNQIGQWLREYYPKEQHPNGRTLDDDRASAYLCLRLTQAGGVYADEYAEGEE